MRSQPNSAHEDDKEQIELGEQDRVSEHLRAEPGDPGRDRRDGEGGENCRDRGR